MEEILVLLKPWQNSIRALLGFSIIRYLYKTVILRILHKATQLSPFSLDEDILEAFEHPVNLMLAIGGLYLLLSLFYNIYSFVFVSSENIVRHLEPKHAYILIMRNQPQAIYTLVVLTAHNDVVGICRRQNI